MTHDQVVACLVYLYPGVQWSYDGDGSTLDPVPGVSTGLVWYGPPPKPTMTQLEAVLATVETQPAPLTVQEKVASALQQIQTGDGTNPVTANQLAAVIQALTS